MGPWACYDCGRGFCDEHALMQHCEAMGHRGEWACDECDGVFRYPSELELEQHCQSAHQMDAYYCNPCNREFCNGLALFQHNRDKHTAVNQQQLVVPNLPIQQVVQQYQLPQLAQQTFRCNLCQYSCLTYNIQETSQTHESTYHSWRCEICGTIYRTEGQLQQHKRTTHNFVCSNCHNTTFPTNELLQQHMSSYHSWKCTIEGCNQTFVISLSLDQHKRDHHNFPCLVATCGEVFTTRNSLKQHTLAKHSFPCTICGNRKFSTLQDFQNHNLQVHSFKCGPCNLSFGTRPALESHNATRHTTYCHACEKDFPSESYNHHLSSFEHLTKVTAGKITISSSSAIQSVNTSDNLPKWPALEPQNSKAKNEAFIECGKCPAMFKDTEALQHLADGHICQCTECFENYSTPKILVKHLVTEHIRRAALASTNSQLNAMEILKSEKTTLVSMNNKLRERNSELETEYVTIKQERLSHREESQNQLEELSQKLRDCTTSKDATIEQSRSTLSELEVVRVELNALSEWKKTAMTHAVQKEALAKKVTDFEMKFETLEKEKLAKDTEITNLRNQVAAYETEKRLKDTEVNVLKGQLDVQKTSAEKKLKETQLRLEVGIRVQNAMHDVFTSLRNAHPCTNKNLKIENLDPSLAAMLRSPVMRCDECTLSFRTQLDLLLHFGGKSHKTQWALITSRGL